MYAGAMCNMTQVAQVLVQEVFKLAISLVGLARVPGGFAKLRRVPLASWLKYSIPGILYCINNNLFHHVRPPPAFLFPC